MKDPAFWSSIIQSLAWPIASIVILLLVKDPLKTLVSSIRRVKYGDLEAEIEQTVREANATIEHLRSLAASLATPAVFSLYHSGYMTGGPTMRERIESADSIAKQLALLGVETDAINKLLNPIRWRVEMYIANQIGDKYGEVIRDMGAKEPHWLKKKMDAQVANTTPDAWRKLLESEGIDDSELNELLEDFDTFKETGSLRRPEKYGEGGISTW